LRQVELLGTFDYFLGEEKLKMKMIGLMHLSVACPEGASKIIADGDLKLKQQFPVLIDSITRTVFNQNPLTNSDSKAFEQLSSE
jgi:hypothetical protein